MSEDGKSFSDSLLLEESERGGVVIKGLTDTSISASSGLKEGDEIVGATVHLDHLSKQDVLKVLKVLEPYDDNMKVLTKSDLSAGINPGSLSGLTGPAKMLSASYKQKKLPSLEAQGEAPVLNLTGLNTQLNSAIGLNGDINGELPNLNKPSADGSGTFRIADTRLPGLDLNGAGLGGSISTPSAELAKPNATLKKPGVKGGIFKANKFEMPNFNLPEIGGTGPTGGIDLGKMNTNLDTPAVNIPTAGVNLSVPTVDAKTADLNLKSLNLNGPDVNLNSPDVNLAAPKVDMNAGKIKWPHHKWKGPKVNPDLSLSTPKIDGELSTPDVGLDLPKANLDGPNLDADIDAPKINWPHLKWKKPKLDLEGPNADMDVNADLKTPDLNLSPPGMSGGISTPNLALDIPEAELEGPDLDINAPSGKVNWPHKKWKKPKLDADLNTPDVNAPNMHLNLPKADINGPNIDVPAPDFDVASSPKINWPHKKWKKPKVDADLNTPDIDVSTPSLDGDLTGPDVGMPALSGKNKYLTLKKPKNWLIGQKLNAPDVDLNADVNSPALDLTTPKVSGSLDGPDMDLSAPNMDIDAPSGKVKWPTLKKPKWFKSPSLDLQAPDVDVKAPDLNLVAPALDGGVDTPDIGITLPNADLKGPDVDLNADIDSPSSKLPKFHLPKFKGPDIDASAGLPNLDLNAPKLELKSPDLSTPEIKGGIDAPSIDIEVPKAHIKADASSRVYKFPSLKMPSWSSSKVKGPELDGDLDTNVDLSIPGLEANLPKADLSTPSLNLSGSKIDGGLSSPDFDLNLPKAGINGPDADLDTSGKFKLPKMKLPTFGFSKPKVEGPDLDADIDVDLPKADIQGSAANLNLSAPNVKGNLSTPDLDLNLPKAGINGPDADLDTSGKFKLPKMKLPTFGGFSKPKVEGPDLDADIDVNLPKADIQGSAANLNLSAPNVKGNLSTPDLDLNLPKAGINGPDADLDTSGKFNLPKMKLPTFGGFSKPKVEGPDLDADIDVNLPKADIQGSAANLNLSAPNVKGNLSTPDLDLNLPKAKINGPDVDADVDTSGKFKLPKIKLPTFGGFSKPKVEGPDLDADINVPNANISVPKLDVDLPKADVQGSALKLSGNAPDVNVGATPGEFKMPHYKFPGFGLSSPKVDGPTADIGTPDLSITGPSADSKLDLSKLKIDTQAASVNLSEPSMDVNEGVDLSVNTGAATSKMPHFKLPKFGFLGHGLKTPDVDANADMDMSASVKPNVNMEVEGNADVEDSPKSKRKWPFHWGRKNDSGAGSGTEEGSDSGTEGEADVPAFTFHKLPKSSIDDGIGFDDSLGPPKSEGSLKKSEQEFVVSRGIRLPKHNTLPNTGEKIDIMERLKLAREKSVTSLTEPKLDALSASASNDSPLARGGTFKVTTPDLGLGLDHPVVGSSGNDKMSLSLSNMLGLNVKDA